MSGFVAVWNRDGGPEEPARASVMLAALAHRGPDGSRLVSNGSVALGHQHFWTTPEEVGERQPVVDDEAGLSLVFDGRVDNRDELVAALGGAGSRSDAAIVLAAYRRWGSDGFARLIGPFALVVFDSRRRRLVAARDVLGRRTLYYALRRDQCLVASEECALLAHPDVDSRPNVATLAAFFAERLPRNGATFFTSIRELVPAHVLSVSPEGESTARYWSPDLEKRLDYRSDEEYAQHFRQLLAESVRARLRTVGRPGVMLSGGMDSTSVAGLAAAALGSRGSEPLLSFSWVFDELAECDERRWIAGMVERFGLEAAWVSGDRRAPLDDLDAWPIGPNNPWSNPFELLKQDVYRTAAARGCRVLFDSAFADFYYSPRSDWLVDLVHDGRLPEAGRAVFRRALSVGARSTLMDPAVRRLGRHALRREASHDVRDRNAFPWLTERGWRLASEASGPWLDPLAERARRPEQFEGMFHPPPWLDANIPRLTNVHRIECRDPFRDRRLVEFMLAVPAHQLYRWGRAKFVQRNAMSGLLPQEITERTVATPLTPLFLRGLAQRNARMANGILMRRDAAWRDYVSERWLSVVFPERLHDLGSGFEAMVPWQCISAQVWDDGMATSK